VRALNGSAYKKFGVHQSDKQINPFPRNVYLCFCTFLIQIKSIQLSFQDETNFAETKKLEDFSLEH
jgi:hypothetical protein